jgi:Asp/Glu/hydantoin racemase
MPVVELAQAIEKDGFDGIWLTDFDMCGVEAAREVIDIPIIGGFPAAAMPRRGRYAPRSGIPVSALSCLRSG